MKVLKFGGTSVAHADQIKQVKQIMYEDGNAMAVHSIWGERVKLIVPVMNEAQARRTGISRSDIANAR